MFHHRLPTLILLLLYLFFIFNHSIFSLSLAANSPSPKNANFDRYSGFNNFPKQREFTFGRINTVATIVTILLALLNIIFYKLRILQESNFSDQLHTAAEGQLCRQFSIYDILKATNHFNEALVIGQGGFGKVYKGVIDDGTITVAIKRLNRRSRQGAPEFWNEVEMLSSFRHSHLVSLIGYCNYGNEMILVYEYMVHGNLADHLHKKGADESNISTLSWVQRLKICIGAARGLDYLHTGTGIQHRVIHRDVKSSNILLDENWAAKISDFGLSKTGPANQSCTHISTNVKGTFGYIDPEYFLTHRLTRKSDVYAFGVVLFEVLCGRRAVDVRLEASQWSLAGWAQQCVNEGKLGSIIDSSLEWEIFPSSLDAFAQIAIRCLCYESKERPTMAEVVAALESALALQQKRDSSMIEMEDFDIFGTYDNQENAEQQEVIGAGNGVHEEEKKIDENSVLNVVNADEQIDDIIRLGDASSRLPPKKTSRKLGFRRIVGNFFNGTAQLTSVKPTENANSSAIQQEIIGDVNGIHVNLDSLSGQQEVINVRNEDTQIDEIVQLGDSSSRLPPVKPAKITGFTRIVLQIFGTAQVTSVDSTAKPRNNRGKRDKNNSVMNKDGDVQQSLQLEIDNLKIFTYAELETATGNFWSKFMIGEGVFGSVFKGWAKKKAYGPSEIMAVAIKKFELDSFGEYINWKSEVELLGQLRHPNIVNALGYCLEMQKFIVVYEYMEMGSLERHLFSGKDQVLSWGTRLKIAIGAARGFAFLHSTQEKDIYRQFKSHNILLDQDFNAKLSDIQLPEIDYSFVNYYFPGVQKTLLVRGYDYTDLPLEYMATGYLDKKGHVYCFGVVLLEILIGAKASSVTNHHGNSHSSGHSRLEDCAQELLSDEREVSKVIDPRLEGEYPINDVYQYAQLSLKCLDRKPTNRPSMDEILKTLEHIAEESNLSFNIVHTEIRT